MQPQIAPLGGSAKADQYKPLKVSEVDSEQSPNITTEDNRHPIYFPSEWLLETVSSPLAMGLVIAIPCIFSYMDGKRLSGWSAGVSQSATISILTTAYAAALMQGVSTFIGQLKWLYFKDGQPTHSHLETFDEASRGNLTTIGTVITISRLTFSPSVQQVILTTEQREVNSTGAIFQCAHSYSRNLVGHTATTRTDKTPFRFANLAQDPGMQFAIMQGLCGINMSAPFSCPGACNWTDSYVSLGFKSACQNVTQKTLRSLQLGLPETFPEIARFGIYRSSGMGSLGIDITQCSFYLTAYEYITASVNSRNFTFALVATNETRINDDKSIPALGIHYLNLIALGNFFEPPTFVTEGRGHTRRFEHMATAMTDYGEKMESIPYVSIRWGYFAVLIMTEGLAVLFAVLTVLSNRRSRRVPLRKPSTLAVLACPVEESGRLLRDDAGGRYINELHGAVEKTEVRLS
ncbi:hypothetical protein BDW71DRAFT_217744 [Aspergillus fruticulosus]